MVATVLKGNLGETHVAISDSLEVWHARLGHPAMGTVKELIKKGLVSCKVTEADGDCEECVLGKAKKLPYPKAVS